MRIPHQTSRTHGVFHIMDPRDVETIWDDKPARLIYLPSRRSIYFWYYVVFWSNCDRRSSIRIYPWKFSCPTHLRQGRIPLLSWGRKFSAIQFCRI